MMKNFFLRFIRGKPKPKNPNISQIHPFRDRNATKNMAKLVGSSPLWIVRVFAWPVTLLTNFLCHFFPICDGKHTKNIVACCIIAFGLGLKLSEEYVVGWWCLHVGMFSKVIIKIFPWFADVVRDTGFAHCIDGTFSRIAALRTVGKVPSAAVEAAINK